MRKDTDTRAMRLLASRAGASTATFARMRELAEHLDATLGIEMPSSRDRIDFPPFELDLRGGRLCRDGTPVPLRPKTFAVLEHLAQRPGELVTKQAVLDTVWGGVAVSEDVVRLSVGELRTALGDDRAAPRFIETVPRRGYRFVAKLDAVEAGTTQGAMDLAADDRADGGVVVGRTRERAEIAGWLRAATSGRRQIGFVAGEAGIGKTTLVDTVLRDLRRTPGAPVRIARGQCIQQYGGGAAYLPVLDAIGALCRGPDGLAVEASLRDHAPDWFLRELAPLATRPADPAQSAGTPERTLQRLAASLDALAADVPLVLVLEDMQWSDYSTLDLLSVVARRHEAARLLVLCTLRPAEAIVHGHPVASVQRELLRTGLCREMLLDGLSAAEVATYLAGRFSGADLAEDVPPLVVERSAGNPFFMVALVDHLVEQQLVVRAGTRWELRRDVETLRTAIPEGLRAVIEPGLERLAADELRVLEAASVAGPEFAAHAVARVAPQGSDLGDVEYVERICAALVRRQEILRAAGETVWPDGTESARYAFRHALYQEVAYQRLSSSVRRRLHQTMGEQLEAAYAGRTADVASELAAHFDRSRDGDRAVRYHGEAAARATSRSAYQEARVHLEAALALLAEQPETPERVRREMACLQDLGQTLFAIEGYGGAGGASAFARMRQLADRLEGNRTRFSAMEGELAVCTMRAEFAAARALSAEMLALSEPLGDPTAIANTHVMRSATLFNLGEIEGAQDHAERARALFDAAAPPLAADVGILASIMLASISAYRGRVARARAYCHDALARADTLDTPFQRGFATNLTAQVCSLLRDLTSTRSFAEETVRLASENAFSYLKLTAIIFRASCDVEDGRVADGLGAMRRAFQEYRESGQRYSTSYHSGLLARAHLAGGDVAAADQVLDDALAFVAETGERAYEPELFRLKGECLLADAATRGRKAAAAAWFERAMATAAERGALLFEIRAATSLYRLRTSAREQVVRLVARFDAEDDCTDLHDASEVLGGRGLGAR